MRSSLVASQGTISAMIPCSRARSRACSASVGNSSGQEDGSSTNWANRTARQAANGRRAHQRCNVEGCPCRIDFSRAEALLMASSGMETSMSFLRRAVSADGIMSSLLPVRRCPDRSDGDRPVNLVETRLRAEDGSRVPDIDRLVDEAVLDEHYAQNARVCRIQRRKQLIPRDRDALRVSAPALDLDETQGRLSPDRGSRCRNRDFRWKRREARIPGSAPAP